MYLAINIRILPIVQFITGTYFDAWKFIWRTRKIQQY